MVARHDTVIMLAYSPIKNIANLKLAYSVWKPATSSPSASGKSKGKRLVSAIAAGKKQKKPITCGMGDAQMLHRARQTHREPCIAAMISRMLQDAASSST